MRGVVDSAFGLAIASLAGTRSRGHEYCGPNTFTRSHEHTNTRSHAHTFTRSHAQGRYPLGLMSDELTVRETRLKKLERMRELGCDPFLAEKFSRPKSAEELLAGFEENQPVEFAGRV